MKHALLDAMATALSLRTMKDWEDAIEGALEMACDDLPYEPEKARKLCDDLEKMLKRNLGVLVHIYGLLEEIANAEVNG